MQEEKILQKKLQGLTPEEQAELLQLEESVELEKAKPNIIGYFLSFVK